MISILMMLMYQFNKHMKCSLVMFLNALLAGLLLACKARDSKMPFGENCDGPDGNMLIEEFERRFWGHDEPPSMYDVLSVVFGLENPKPEDLDSMQIDSYGEGGYSFFHFEDSVARLGGRHGVIIGIYSNVNENAEFYERAAISVEILEGKQNWVFKWSGEKHAYIDKKGPKGK